ncbi:MAG TPA: mandelate racemase/muconate lactonizing enzyme family protein [Lacipirellulaceae bacterium]|nr:mandelate racemase/muconate lactonizing enzyme family protein [Lacipirellulaceae bacterium]
MKIVKIETLHFAAASADDWRAQFGGARQAMPNNLWVRVHTEDGLVGLGETYYTPRAIAAVVHDTYAPLLLGRDALDIENHWNNCFSLASFCGYSGAEMRALSAIDIALWDLAGQHLGQPIYSLLGGRNRDRVPVYNTCVSSGSYRDLDDVLHGRAGDVAKSLLEQGYRAMKIWPFDQFGDTLAGPTSPRQNVTIWGGTTAAGILSHSITNEEIRCGVRIVEEIRRAVGDEVQVAIEGHARWDLPSATRIARALEPLDIMWLEEIMPPDNVESYVRLKTATSIPICQSERVFTRFQMRPWIEKAAADIIMPDFSWCGGFTEGRKICSLADTYFLPITSHDTIGPVGLWAAAHLMLHIPNAMSMETVRGYIDGWYEEVVTDKINITDGHLFLAGKPGLGTKLRDDFLARPDAVRETTTVDTLKRW